MISKLLDKVLGPKQPVGHHVIVCTDCGFRRCSCIHRCPGKCRNREYVLERALGEPSQAIKEKNYWPLVLIADWQAGQRSLDTA